MLAKGSVGYQLRMEDLDGPPIIQGKGLKKQHLNLNLIHFHPGKVGFDFQLDLYAIPMAFATVDFQPASLEVESLIAIWESSLRFVVGSFLWRKGGTTAEGVVEGERGGWWWLDVGWWLLSLLFDDDDDDDDAAGGGRGGGGGGGAPGGGEGAGDIFEHSSLRQI